MLRNNRDWFNFLRAVAAPAIFFLPFWYGLPEGYEVLAALAIFFVIDDTNYILHLHIHYPFSKNRWVNLGLDLAMGSVTGMTASNWRIQHLYGHHVGKDLRFRGRGVSWELERFTPLRALSYSLRTLPPTFFEPIREAYCLGVIANVKTPIVYRWAFAEHLLLFALLGALSVIDLSLVLTYVIPMYALTFFITRYVDYLNHYGCDEGHENRLYHANNCLHPGFNANKNNFGYHTAHHINPGAHWTRLPQLHAEIEEQIPEELKKRFSWSFLLFPYHLLLAIRDRT